MTRLIRLLVVLALCFGATLVLAQDAPVDVTADDVNAIAQKLYCPVCENIPLDVCGTAACADWRNEIRQQLESGMGEDAIVTDFVRRFGDRVVGTPQDPVLAALSIVTPIVIIVLVAAGAVYFLMRNRRKDVPAPETEQAEASSPYYDLLRKDVEG
ncbi:MAG TPA: cytochrome c-type biogenesis protein CcmH [Candidatus Limnocylindrales bacterium]|nr:cytochrome c-type biogenesis protein CcmH [Candidatus Limnocylindrales bacterium]